MVEEILKEYEKCSYDFQEHACPGDSMRSYFPEWINYYRLKVSIARVLQPEKILEIGVRYGYSIRAFLEGCPRARVVGIDADSSEFGGETGAPDWALKSLQAEGFQFELIKDSSMNYSVFPGGEYDLIHIDGQQDGEGTFHDLDLAAGQGRYILVDGYYWSKENFHAVNEWLLLNKTAVKYAMIIPGYAGEMLIKTKLREGYESSPDAKASEELKDLYTSGYYLNDCGGYEIWNRTDGRILDARLQAVANIGKAFGPHAKTVDLGCGRGELTAFFARNGSKVTAIDYSSASIEIARKMISRNSDLSNNITLVEGSVLDESAYEGDYNLAVAADIIEHLFPEELDRLYEIISDRTRNVDGIFVVHTTPNLWKYKYQHPKEQRKAIQAGFWLPRTRRTWYERKMHVNEQNPRILKKQLKKYFKHVRLWFMDEGNPGGSLMEDYGIVQMRNAGSLFVVATNGNFDENKLLEIFQMQPLVESECELIKIHMVNYPELVSSGKVFEVEVCLQNESDRYLCGFPPYPVNLSYHWLNAEGEILIQDGLRTEMKPPLPAREKQNYNLKIKAPDFAGIYYLKLSPVQEMKRWLENSLTEDPVSIKVE